MRFQFLPRIKLLLGLVAIAAITATPASAQLSEAGFGQYLDQLKADAVREGIDPALFEQVRPTLRFSETAIRIDMQASGGTDPNRPIPNFTGSDEQRAIIGKAAPGRAKYLTLKPQLDRIEAQLGVPPSILLAIYGKESNFGGYTGNFDTPSVLASLAYEGRRRDLFAGEFIAAMRMIQNGTPRSQLTGSFAGAMGKPQFLPSVYNRLAVDGDGDGRSDIWNSEADAMASIANYLVNAGWRRGIPWGIAVAVPAGLDRAAIANRTVPQRCPRVFARHSQWKTMAEWRAMGFAPLGGAWPGDDVMATLLEPDGQGAPGYLLTVNYRAILDYNCSNFYAMGVGLLANEIDR